MNDDSQEDGKEAMKIYTSAGRLTPYAKCVRESTDAQTQVITWRTTTNLWS